MAVELATAFVSIAADTSRIGPALRRAFNGAERDARRAGETSGRQMGDGLGRGLGSSGASEHAGRQQGQRYARAFAHAANVGVKSLATGFVIASGAVTGLIRHVGTIATVVGLASKITRGFAFSMVAASMSLRAVAKVGLTKLAASLKFIARIASVLARDIARVTAALLVLAAVARVMGAMTRAARMAGMAVIGLGTAVGLVAAGASVVGGVLRSAFGPQLIAALSAAGMAMVGVAGAAAGILGPAMAVGKIAFKGMADGAKEFNEQFKESDKIFDQMIGQRMGPLLTAFRGLKQEITGNFTQSLIDPFVWLGGALDGLKPKLGGLATTLGNVGGEIAGTLNMSAATGEFDKMIGASDTFFQNFLGESGIAGLTGALVSFAAMAADTFKYSGETINGVLFDISDWFKNITPEDLTGAVEHLRGVFATLQQTFRNVMSVAGPLFNAFRELGEESASTLAPGFRSVGEAIAQATPGLVEIARNIMPALSQVMTNLAPLLPTLVEAFTPWSEVLAAVAPHIASIITFLGPMAPMLLAAATAAKLISIGMVAWNAAAFAGSVAIGIHAAATGRSSLALRGNVVALAAHRVAMIAGTIASAAFGVALQIAMSPITLIVAAIALLIGGLVLLYKKNETFRTFVQKAWSAIKDAWVALWEGALKPGFDKFMAALRWIGDAALWLWNSAILPAFNGIKAAIGVWWTAVQVYFNAAKTVVLAIGNAALWLWNNAIVPAFNGIKAAINVWWSAVQVYFNAVKTVIFAIGDAAMWLWNNAIMPAFNGIKMIISAWWSAVQIYFNAVKAAIGFVGDAAMWLWNNAIRPAFEGIGAIISGVWNGIVRPTFDALKAALGAVGDFFSFVWNSIIKPVWDALGTGVSAVINSVIIPAFEVLKTGLTSVRDFFSSVVESIKTVWNGLKAAAAIPINFIIEQVWNGGLVKAWNTVRGFLPMLPEAKTLDPVKFATGGHVSGPGTATSDSIMARLSTGEHVLDAKDVQGLGGQRVVYALRNLIERGIPFTWDQAHGLAKLPGGALDAIGSAPPKVRGEDPAMSGFLHGILPGFDGGGEVRPAWEYQLENGHRAAKMRDGNPYTWGFEDCSGYVSAIADAIINGGDGKWTWATGSFPGGQPWQPGLGKGFSVGVNNDPGGPGGGHTSGTLTGVGNYTTTNVESGGSHGNVRYGGPAKGADDGQWESANPGRFHLAIGADGAFESAGGPSTEDQEGGIKKKIREIIESLTNPIKEGMAGAIGSPPPEILGIPPAAFDLTRDTAIDAAFAVVGGLGGALRSTWETAKRFTPLGGIADGVGGVVDGITGLFRDKGGYIPNGMSIVRNETGKPEAVLNWDQLKLIESIMTRFGLTFPQAMKQAGMNPDEERAKAEAAKQPESADPAGSKEKVDRAAAFQEQVAQIAEDSFWEFFDTQSIFGVSAKSVWDHWSGPFKKDDAATVGTSGTDIAPTGETEPIYTPDPGASAIAPATPGDTSDPTNEQMGVGKDWGIKQPEITVAPETGPSHDYNPSGGAEQWRGLAEWAIDHVKKTMSGPAQTQAMVEQIDDESGGNPRAVNNYDSNAAAGTPSGGLLQVIEPTFQAYRDHSLANDKFDPPANLVAALNYYADKYGQDLTTRWGNGKGGYKLGGFTGNIGVNKPAGIVHGREFVVNAEATARNRGVLAAINGGMDLAPVSGGRSGGPQTVYNIQAGNTERAFIEAQRLDKKRLAIGLGSI